MERPMVKSIQIYGTGCASCEKLYQVALTAVKEIDHEIRVEKIEDLNALLEVGVMRTPGLGFNGKLIMQGKLMTPATLKNRISAFSE